MRADQFARLEPRVAEFNARARELGSDAAGCAARSRSACWETRRERRPARRHAGSRPRPRALAGRTRRPAVPARSRRGGSRPQRPRPRAARRAARRCDRRGALRPARAGVGGAGARYAFAALGRVDTVVVTAGLFATQDALEADPALARRVLEADFTGTVLFCEAARARLLAAGGGTLCVFSSVAGERGRKSVVLYGAAKAGLSRYLEGLDHRFHAQGLRVICVKPGFVRTSMTEGLAEPPFAADAGGGCAPGARRDRARYAGGLGAAGLALGDAGDPPAAARRDAPRRLLSSRLSAGRSRPAPPRSVRSARRPRR